LDAGDPAGDSAVSQDAINGLFELVGSVFLWMHVRKLAADKSVRGVDWRSVAFFWAWGIWNLYYYPSLDQWWSLCGGVSIAIANGAWVIMLVYYRNGQLATDN
jgi:hypothetical protein